MYCLFPLLVFPFAFSLCWLPFFFLSHYADRSLVWSPDPPCFLFIPAVYAISSRLMVSAAFFVQVVLRGTSLSLSFSELQAEISNHLLGVSTINSVCLRLNNIHPLLFPQKNVYRRPFMPKILCWALEIQWLVTIGSVDIIVILVQ